MTENTEPVPGAAPAPPPPPPPPSAVPARPPLRRSRTDRVLAGVAGGTAQWLGIDPVVVRVVLVVLALFGGSGLVLYVLGWLFIPEDGATESEAQRILGRSGRPGTGTRTAMIVLGVVLGVLLLSMVSGAGAWLGGWGSWGGGSLLLLAAVGGLVLYLLNRPPAPVGPPPPPVGPDPRAGWSTGSEGGAVTPAPALATAAPSGAADATATGDAPVGYSYGGYGGYSSGGYGYGYAAAPVPPAPPAPRRRSYLGAATLSVALVVMGLLGVLGGTGVADVPVVVVLAAGLGVLGLGLLVGAFAGRAKWLIALALPLLLVTAVASVVPANLRFDNRVGTQRWAPTTPAAAAVPFSVDVGDAELDLTGLVLPPGSTATYPVRARVGTGRLEVEVPRNVRVNVTATTGLGEMDIPGVPRQEGANLRVVTTLPGVVAETSPTLDLVVEVGLGDLEVSRAAS